MLPHLDYTETIWGNQPGLTLKMQQLQAFAGGKLSAASAEAPTSLKWFPLHGRRFGQGCLTVRNENKGDVPE